MTTKEYLNLRSLLMAGCMAERVELIDGLSPRQLTDFAERLDLPHHELLAMQTWRWIARVLAIRYSQDLDRIDGPVVETETASRCELEAAPATILQTPAA